MMLNVRVWAKILVLMLVALTASWPVYAAMRDEPPSYFKQAHEYQWLLDESGRLPVLQAVAQSTDWAKVPGNSVNQHYSQYPLWLRFDVDVQTGKSLRTVFEVLSPFLDTIDFYLVGWNNGNARILARQSSGDHYAGETLQRTRYPLFQVEFPHSGHYSLFLRIESTGGLLFPVKLHYEDRYFQTEVHSQVFYGIYFGVILVLAYFNLMLMVYLREPTFVHNLFFVLSIGLYQASISGFGAYYLWPGSLAINDHVLELSAVASFFFGGLFAMQFLELKVRAPLLHKLASALMAGYVLVAMAVPVVSESRSMAVLQVLSLVTALFAICVMFQQVLQRNPWAHYLLLGWSVTIGGYCVYVAAMLGWIVFDDTIMYLQALGLGVGNVLMTTAIAARVRRERREKAIALRHALELSREVTRLTWEKEQLENNANRQLQREVEEKTHELNQMLEYLQSSNRRLEQDSQCDPLTGLFNRRYLDTLFPEAIQQCQRHRSPLGVLVVDADHFKKINDKYGHLAGDLVLRKLATILQTYCRRNLDILVRYGGEEFVMLLPATDLDGVLKIAESIRHHVQYAQFWFEDQRVPVTVSLGIHVGIPPVHASPENLMHKADDALYKAKSNGRNRVEVFNARFEVVKA